MHHTQRHAQSHFKQKHILPSRNLSEGHENSVACTACDIQQVPGSNASDMQRKWSTKTSTKHRTSLTAKKVVYQKLKRLACTLPVGSSILGQRLTAKKNHQKPTASEVLTNTLRKTSNEQSHACPTATGATITKDENSTWPETCKTCQHRFWTVLLKHAQGRKASSHVGPKRNMPKHASIASRPFWTEWLKLLFVSAAVLCCRSVIDNKYYV